MTQHQRLLIIDFGSQVTQLIARRLRELNVFCEIRPYQSVTDEALRADSPQAVILSGGPDSVTREGSPRAPQALFDLGIPVFGICYGQQTMMQQLGGRVEAGHHAEYGRAFIAPAPGHTRDGIFAGLFGDGREEVWMSHGDRVTALAPGFEVIGTSPNAPFAMIADESRRFYAVQFHPEVHHTPNGRTMLENFVRLAGFTGDWTMAGYRAEAVRRIREQVGDGKVICGLSGGVDSSVAAVLIHEAIGDQRTCVFVDHGLLRLGEAEEVVTIDLRGRSAMADHMVIASGRNARQVASIAEKLVERLKEQTGRSARVEGKDTGDWVLIDTDDVIVHVFRPEVREFYQLEKMWMPADALRSATLDRLRADHAADEAAQRPQG